MDFRSLQSLALKVGEALTLDEVFERIVEGLAAEDGVALARVWLISAGDLCDSCKMRQACPDQSRCLHLVASAGASLDSTEDWSHIDGHFRRMPLGVGKVGRVGAAGPLLCGPDLRGNPLIARPEWVDRERIISFAGQPLVYRGETLGVLAVFSRTEITVSESDWLRIFADHAAIAISNARAFQEVGRLQGQLELDIEELKRAEAELRTSEARYRHIFQAAGVSIWEEDYSAVRMAIDGLKAQGVTDFREHLRKHPEFVRDAVSMVRIIDVNETTVSLLRARTKQEILASLDRVFLPETLDAFAEALIAIAEGRPAFEAETVLRTIDGTRLSVLFTIVFPRDPAGLGSVLVSVIDITERNRLDKELHRSQAYLIAAQELSHVGSWAMRIATGEGTWSEETLRIFGLDPRGPTPTFEQSRQAWHPHDRDVVDQTLAVAAREKRGFDVDLRIVRPDGSIREVHGKGEPILDDAGELVEWMGVVMDVTERKRAERALRRARERTLEARFAAMLAERTRMAREIHDTLLQGFTGVALRLVAVTGRVSGQPETSAALREVIGLAQSTLQDARRAVWDLRLPGLAAGDFSSAVRTAAEDCTGGTPLDLEFGVGGSPRPVDPEVESTVVRVAQEAIANVVKHADAHRVRVKLSFESHRLRLSVSDDGCGFAVSPDFHGYGGHWGLIGMRERASQVRGKLKLRSIPGRGTELVLLVPYSDFQGRQTG